MNTKTQENNTNTNSYQPLAVPMHRWHFDLKLALDWSLNCDCALDLSQQLRCLRRSVALCLLGQWPSNVGFMWLLDRIHRLGRHQQLLQVPLELIRISQSERMFLRLLHLIPCLMPGQLQLLLPLLQRQTLLINFGHFAIIIIIILSDKVNRPEEP